MCMKVKINSTIFEILQHAMFQLKSILVHSNNTAIILYHNLILKNKNAVVAPSNTKSFFLNFEKQLTNNTNSNFHKAHMIITITLAHLNFPPTVFQLNLNSNKYSHPLLFKAKFAICIFDYSPQILTKSDTLHMLLNQACYLLFCSSHSNIFGT